MPKSAAEATPPAGNRFVEFDEFIDYQLTKASRGIQSTDVLVGVVGAALGLTVYLFVFILADHWLVTGGLSAPVRVLYWAVGFGALGYWVTTRLIRPLNSKVNTLYAARQIEKSHPALKSSLLVLTDLKQAGRSTAGPIRGSLEKRAAVGLSKADVDDAIDRRTLMNSSYSLLFVLAVFCGYALFSPKSILQSAWRALMPFTHTGVATRTRIDHVDPGNAEVPALSHLDVQVEISGQAPKEATLYYTTADRTFVDEAVPLRDTGEGLRRYKGTLIGTEGRGLRQSLSYYVAAGDARSETYSVTVVQSPSAVVDSVAYEYQSYTGLANKEEPGGAIDAWEGTRIKIQATANQKVKSAMVLFSDTENTAVKAEELPMLIHEGTKLSASWQLAFRSDHSFPKFYRIQVTTEDGHQDPLPTLQPVNVRPDLPPKVEIVFPKSDVQAPVNSVIGIAYRASDPDFKLRSLVLNLEHDGKILPLSPRLFDGPPDEESREGVYKLKLKDLNLKAGSRVTYWLDARDNFMTFGDRGPNKTLSPRLNIDIVEPQKPEEQKKSEQAAEKDARQALNESRPEQGQQGGAEQPAEQKPAGASESKPSEEPKPGDGQEKENPEAGKANQESRPDVEPMKNSPQSERNEKSQQKNAANQQGEKGESGEPGSKNQTQEGQEGQRNPSQQQGAGQESSGSQGANSSKANESPNSAQNQKQGEGGQSGKRDAAPEDTALKKLLEWNERKQQEDRERQQKAGSSKPENQPPENQPQEKRGQEKQAQPGAQGSQQGDEKSPNSKSGQEKNASAESKESQDNKQSSATDKGKEPPGAESKRGEKSNPGEQDKNGDSANKREKNATDDGTGSKSEQKPAGERDKQGQKPDQPRATDDKTNSKQPGDDSPMPMRGESTDSKPEKSADQQADSPNKPGDENAKSPTQQKGAPGEKAPSNEAPKDKQGGADANSKGQESPTGESGDRPMPGEQNAKPQEKPGNSDQKPVGKNDKEGTREAGEGEPGSSSPSDSGGQKSKGQGEAGKAGQKSESGEKSGAEKSSNGKQSSQSGSKSGGSEQGSGSKQFGDDKQAGQQSGKSGNDSQKSGPSSQSSDDKKGDNQSNKPDAGSKPDESPSDNQDGGKKSGSDQKQGAGDQKSGGDQQSGGDQKHGGDQKPGGDQKQAGGEKQSGDLGGEQKGGEGKSGEQGSSGQGADGKGNSKAGSSQAGKNPGAGGAGSSGSAAASDGNADSGKGTDSTARPDPANLDYKKKATNLALKRLQETLERGQIDPELQKELGFTDDEMRSFMDRLQERLADNGDDNSAEAQARRRQFEQLLKGVDLETKTTQRAAGDGNGPAGSGFGSSKKPAPREYRAAEKKYRESLNGQKSK